MRNIRDLKKGEDRDKKLEALKQEMESAEKI